MKNKKIRVTDEIYSENFKEFTKQVIDSAKIRTDYLNDRKAKKAEVSQIEVELIDLYGDRSELEEELNYLNMKLLANKKRYAEDLKDHSTLVNSFYNSEEIDLSEYGITEKVLTFQLFNDLMDCLMQDIDNLSKEKGSLELNKNIATNKLNNTNRMISYKEQKKALLNYLIDKIDKFLNNQDNQIQVGNKRIKKLGQKRYNGTKIKN